ncbi:MAG TPA: site-2 protease family protein [Patescibacteria group bacterium]|nr:site-2 protease family protein [Patescibacteria group bacterium]
MDALVAIVILVFSAILHEVAHGFVAEQLGDPTARLSGRLTLNPQKHIDLYMTILLPLITFMSSGGSLIFGGAKPVPVDPFNLKDGRKDLALVSLSGPLTNVALAILASLIIRLVSLNPGLYAFTILPILTSVVKLNLLLAIFNLLPIPPLDGSKVFSLVLSDKDANTYMSLSSFGFIIIIFLLLVPIGGFNLMDLVSNILNFAQNLLLP